MRLRCALVVAFSTQPRPKEAIMPPSLGIFKMVCSYKRLLPTDSGINDHLGRVDRLCCILATIWGEHVAQVADAKDQGRSGARRLSRAFHPDAAPVASPRRDHALFSNR